MLQVPPPLRLAKCSARVCGATRHRGRTRSLAAQAAQQKPPPAAAFDTTPSPVKGLVSALTSLVNAASGLSVAPRGDSSALDTRPPVTPAEVAEGIRGDFTERGYLWTGQISAELYDADAEFTDPTLTFRGLATFQRNLAALQPVLRAVLRTREIDLLALTESAVSGDEGFVEAAWRMGGDLALPWQPRIELTGRTRFYYSPARGGRIVRYVESWDIPATEALLQIVRPFAWKKGAAADNS